MNVAFESLSEKERTMLQLKGLCDEVKTKASFGYVALRLRAILSGGKWNYLVKGIDVVKPENLVQYVYNCYLAVAGLSKRGL